MTSTLIQMALLMAAGMVWRFLKPGGLSADDARKTLTTVVYYLFLPAMVLEVLWKADIGWHSLQYTALGVGCAVFGMLSIGLIGWFFKFDRPAMGAVMLSTAFPNVTYLGLPVLEQTLGVWTRSVVIQLDLFAIAPFLFTVGIAVVKRFGDSSKTVGKPFWTYLNAPPFWAAGAAVLFNSFQFSPPGWLMGALKLLSGAVVPLMLISLGLALSWSAVKLKNIPYMAPIVLIKLLFMPYFALNFVQYLTIENPNKVAAVLDMAMPSMLLGIVFCDRFRLDSALYAMAVTVTTMLSLVTLPYWHQLLITRF